MIIARSNIKRFATLALIFHCVFLYGQRENEVSVLSGNYTALIVNANVGGTLPFPFYNIPDENHADMIIKPYVGIQLNHDLNPRLYLKFNLAYSAKAVDFNAILVDQPYNGYMKQEVNGQVSEVYVEDAYFSGYSEGYYRLKYIELNSSVGRRIGENSGIYLGIYLAFLIEAKNEVYVDGTVSLGPRLPPISSQFQRTQNYSEYVNKTDFGFQIGYEHKIYKKLNVNAQFSSGLHSIYNSEMEAVEFAMINMYSSIGFTYFLGASLFD